MTALGRNPRNHTLRLNEPGTTRAPRGGWVPVWAVGLLVASGLVRLAVRWSSSPLRRKRERKPPLVSPESRLAPSTPAPHHPAVFASASEAPEEDNSRRIPESASNASDTNQEETLLQQVMRLRDSQGREYIYATLRGEVAAGQRGTTVYVGFCPPFGLLPRVEVEVIEGPPASAQVIQVQNHGAQIDVRLDEPCHEPTYVLVEVAAFPDEA